MLCTGGGGVSEGGSQHCDLDYRRGIYLDQIGIEYRPFDIKSSQVIHHIDQIYIDYSLFDVMTCVIHLDDHIYID